MAKTAIPTSTTELEELLNDDKRMTEINANNQLPEVMKAYAVAFNKKSPDVEQQVQEQVKEVLFDFLRDKDEKSAGAYKVTPGNGKNTAVYNSAAPGSSVEKHFDGVADYFQTIWHGAQQNPELRDKLEKVRNASSSHDGASGGFLIPETTRSEILQLGLPSAVVRPRATVIPMSSPRLALPMNDVTSNVSSVYGGITAYWESESAALQDSSPEFGKVTLDANDLTVYTEVPNNLLADGVAFEAFIMAKFPQAMADYEDRAFFNGNGVGQPEGFLTSDAAVEVAKESNQPADTVVWENIIKMYSRMRPESYASAVWIVPPDAFPELATMANVVGTGGAAVWLPDGTGAPTMTLLGRPVIVSQHAPKLGDAGDISFVDLSYYLIGDRQTMLAESSPHFKFQTSKTAFKVISRVDGKVWLQSAVTPSNGGPALSPIVKLAARA